MGVTYFSERSKFSLVTYEERKKMVVSMEQKPGSLTKD
jgi:hypothetical protein